MMPAVRTELRKAASTRLMTGLLAGVLAIVAFAITFALWGPGDGTGGIRVEGAPAALATQADVIAMLGVSGLLNVFVMLFGITFVTGEYRHRTAATTFLGQPQRWKVIAAKSALAAGVGLVFVVITVGFALMIMWAYSSVEGTALPIGARVVRHVGLSAVASMLSGLLGVGIGAVIRSQIVAIVGTLLWLFAVESLASGLLPDLAVWMPFAAGSAITAGGTTQLTSTTAIGVVCAYTAAALAAGTYLTEHRDIA